MKILGIETSCDETAAAVAESCDGEIRILSNIVSSQIEIHKKYGGVVPEVAAREHVKNIIPVVYESIRKAFPDSPSPLRRGRTGGGFGIGAIAVTVGPGLVTSLLTGVETAKSLAYAWDLPLVAVNHIEGHIAANLIADHGSESVDRRVMYPALILTVSGGHTNLVLMEKEGKYKTIGETRDDAAGEAFDKAAKLMGIGYPGGPVIAAEAAKLSITNYELRTNSNRQNFEDRKTTSLPRPMIDSGDFDFSFSGLKTAIRYALENDKDWRDRIPEYCAEFQQAVVDVLIHKTIKAAKKYEAKAVMLAGGVSANKELRKQLREMIKEKIPNTKYLIPDTKYTTDNAAMIAAAGCLKAARKEFTAWQDLKVDCNFEL